MGIYAHGVVDTEHPAIVDGIRNMIRQGYSKESIVKVIGAPAEVVEAHQRLAERQMSGSTKPTRTESEQREMLDRMKKMREKRKKRLASKSVAEELKTEE